MNLETKNVKQLEPGYQDFGWTLINEVRVRHGRRHIKEYVLERNKDMEHYNEIKQLEFQYYNLNSKIKPEVKISFSTAFVLLLLFIIPGIIYIVYLKNKNNHIKENNSKLSKQMTQIKQKVKILQEC